MKKIVIALIGLNMAGCSPKEVPPNENVEALYQQFHGKYRAIHSVSSEAVDVNLDGQASTDMLVEIPDLARQYSNFLELRVYKQDKHRSQNVFLFTQWWPEQYIFISPSKDWHGEPIDYDPQLTVNYAMQSTPRYFSLSPDLKRMEVTAVAPEDGFRWKKPESVTVDTSTNTIQISNKRRLYTRAGVKDVVITTTYKRFTMIT